MRGFNGERHTVGTVQTAATRPGEDPPGLLSEADCRDIANRLARLTHGGGFTTVRIWSHWTGNVRWARNRVVTSRGVRDNTLWVERNIRGATNHLVAINETSDAALLAAALRAERLIEFDLERSNSGLFSHETLEPASAPALFSEATYTLSGDQRVDAAVAMAQSAEAAGVLSAGYIAVSAHSIAILDTLGRSRYFRYTTAECSVTVRDPKHGGSGWAGLDGYDWARIDIQKLAAAALDRCLRSRNPVAVEPGRYTAILEPQAVCALTDTLVKGVDYNSPLDRLSNETDVHPGVFFKAHSQHHPDVPAISELGDKIVDERITLSADPMDPEMGFPPFNVTGDWNDQKVYHPVVWIEHGVLNTLAYGRQYGETQLSRTTGSPNSDAYRMSGGTTSVEEMISTTKRGLLVTRFDGITLEEGRSLLLRGYTRDGLWLVEHGKITKAVKNMVFTESVLTVFNNVAQLGAPQRVYHGGRSRLVPVIVPPLKVNDFLFTALTDAV